VFRVYVYNHRRYIGSALMLIELMKPSLCVFVGFSAGQHGYARLCDDKEQCDAENECTCTERCRKIRRHEPRYMYVCYCWTSSCHCTLEVSAGVNHGKNLIFIVGGRGHSEQ